MARAGFGTFAASTFRRQTGPIVGPKKIPPGVERQALAFKERQMVRRMLLAISFVVALGVAGFAGANSAEAHGHRHGHGGPRGYYGAYYGGGYGYYPNVYRASYYPPTYYGPAYYGGYGGYGGCRDRGGVSISFGF
jgi:hypothetical protein